MHDAPPIIKNNGPRTIILLHGRGGTAEELIEFAEENLPKAKLVALRADDNEWYPHPFTQARQANEPGLSSALKAIEREAKKLPSSKLIILGFSQGACVALEYAARYPRHYGAIIAFSGGLIGSKPEPPKKSLSKTRILITCSEEDPFIPLERVLESADAFRKSEAEVELHTYPGDSHTVTRQELHLAAGLIDSV